MTPPNAVATVGWSQQALCVIVTVLAPKPQIFFGYLRNQFFRAQIRVMSATTLPLASGDCLPAIGLGLWKAAQDVAARTVRDAINIGYRHLDCACDYGNEAEVGAGLSEALRSRDCRRDELWITSKLWNTYHARARPAGDGAIIARFAAGVSRLIFDPLSTRAEIRSVRRALPAGLALRSRFASTLRRRSPRTDSRNMARYGRPGAVRSCEKYRRE